MDRAWGLLFSFGLSHHRVDDDASSKLFTIDHMLLVISSDHKRCWPRAMLAVVGHIDLCTVSMGKGSFCQYDIVRWNSGP